MEFNKAETDQMADLAEKANPVTMMLNFIRQHKPVIFGFRNAICIIAYLCYYGYSVYFRFGDEPSIRMTVFTVFGVLCISWRFLSKTSVRVKIKQILLWTSMTYRKGRRPRVVRWVGYIIMTAGIVVYVSINITQTHAANLYSLIGLLVFGILMLVMSNDKRKVNWHTVYWSMALQFIIGAFVLKTTIGSTTILWFSDRLEEFMAYSDVGSEFVFGKQYAVHNFAFKVMPSVLFFCTVANALVYLGVIPAIVNVLGGMMAFCIDVSPPEAISAVANIMLGGGEVAMMIHRYLPKMQTSQLFAIMTSGMASLGGSSMIMFTSFGIPTTYLIAASAMSAPAALACSKLIFPDERDDDHDTNVVINELDNEAGESKQINGSVPEEIQLTKITLRDDLQNDDIKNITETEAPEVKISEPGSVKHDTNNEDNLNDSDQSQHGQQPRSVIEAVTQGVAQGIRLVVSIMGMLIVFLALVRWADVTCLWLGERVGLSGITLTFLLSYLFYPFAFVMGVDGNDCLKVGELLGIRAIANAALPFNYLGQLIHNREDLTAYTDQYGDDWSLHGNDIYLPALNQTLVNGVISERSALISSYALCGFSSLSTMGMALASMVTFIPDRITEVSQMAFRSFIAATCASYLTACVAGLLA